MEIYNDEKTKKITIARTKLSDGYNYYITVYNYNSSFKMFTINSNYIQKKEIFSKRDAIETAKKILEQ